MEKSGASKGMENPNNSSSSLKKATNRTILITAESPYPNILQSIE